MAESSIATGYISLQPSLAGVQASMRNIFAAIGQDASDALGDGISKGVAAGGSKIKGSLSSALKASADGLGGSVEKELGKVKGEKIAPNVAQPLSKATEKAVDEGAGKGAKSGLIEGVKGAGPAMIAAVGALGLGALIAGGVKGALEGQKGEVKMKASLGLSPEEAKKAADSAKNLFQGNYGNDLGDVQNAVTNVMSSIDGMRTASGADLEEITKKALNMASVFDVDTGRSTQVAGQMMRAFGIDGKKSMDLLSTAMQKVPANVRDDILDASDEYSPFFKMLGYDATQSMNLLVQAAGKGMYGIDKTGDALKEFGLRATEVSDAMGEAYMQIGLDQNEMRKKLLAGGADGKDALAKIVDGIKKIEDPAARAKVALAMFGTPLEDLSLDEIPKFLDTLVNVPSVLGDTAEAAKQLDKDLGDTAAGSWEMFTRQAQIALSEMAMPLIQEFQPMLQQGIQWIKDNKAEISDWASSMSGAFKSVLVPAFQTIMPWVKDFGNFLKDNKETIKTLMPWIVGLAGVIGALSVIGSIVGPIASLTGMLWGVMPAFLGAAGGATAFGISILPLIALGAAVFAVGYAIGTFLYNLTTDFDGTVKVMGDILKGLGNILLGVGVVLLNGIIGILNLIPLAINGFTSAVNTIGGPLGIPAIPSMPTIPFVPLPAMATGGDIMGPTAVLAGDKDPETIVNRGKMNNLIDEILAGKIGQGDNQGNFILENHITIEKGAADDETLADKIAQATAVAVGSAWKQKRA